MYSDTGPAFDSSCWTAASESDDGAPSPFDIPDGHLTDLTASDSDHSDEGESVLPQLCSKFGVWAKKQRRWIDLFYKHGLTHAVMDDALPLLSSPYKTWKTIAARLREDSGIGSGITQDPVCPGHMCFYAENILHCFICGSERPDLSMKRVPKMEWMNLLPRLQNWFLDKFRCEQLFEYMSSTAYGTGDHIRDFFDTEAYKRIYELHGGEEQVQHDIFLGISTDGFQAFKNKSYDVWPIAAIVCNFPPHIRFCVKNVLPFAFIPGPSEPDNLQSFFEPLLAEIEAINANGDSCSCFMTERGDAFECTRYGSQETFRR